jgi:hypothetical protein
LKLQCGFNYFASTMANYFVAPDPENRKQIRIMAHAGNGQTSIVPKRSLLVFLQSCGEAYAVFIQRGKL